MHTRRLLSLIPLSLALAAPAPALAADAGVWTPVPNMTVPRSAPAAVPLADGRVLVVGGTNDLARGAEVYDPATQKWTLTGPMKAGIGGANVVRLADGRVLSAGWGSAELYSPQTNTWTFSALPSWHDNGALAALDGGGAVIAGGTIVFDDENNLFQNASAVFNPNGTWTPAGLLPDRRLWLSAVGLPGNRALVSGGVVTDGHFTYLTAASSLFANGSWSVVPSMSVARSGHLLTLLDDGRVLATGGSTPVARAATTELYTVGGGWAPGASMGAARADHTATRTTSGKVLVAGGADNAFRPVAATELYDRTTNHWAAAGNLGTPRSRAGAAPMRDGRVLIAGGYAGTAATASAEVWAPLTFLSTESAAVFDESAPGVSTTSRVTVVNTGSAALFPAGFTLGGEAPAAFALDARRCATAIAPGAGCTVDVTFTPPVAGTHRAALIFTANTEARTHSIPLSGRGVVPVEMPAPLPGVPDVVPGTDGSTSDRCPGLDGPASRLGCPPGVLADPSISYRRVKGGIKIVAYYVKATSGAQVVVECSRGCARTVTRGKGAKRVRITRLTGKRLANGTKITITASMPGRLTATVTDTVTRRRRIEGRPQCTPVAC
ncbi:choice-of-anchor D domain-containing protein [Solirubrobacter taibaiensis]|nr:choice-of-anchor D domain-containing protein [Solirubrobacter taibaiensis]